MRYIKLYESIGGSYYQEISSNEYSIRASGNTDFTEEEEQELAIMLEFIRLRKNIPELKEISLRLKQLLIK